MAILASVKRSGNMENRPTLKLDILGECASAVSHVGCCIAAELCMRVENAFAICYLCEDDIPLTRVKIEVTAAKPET